ncbi:MAG: protein translocase subunit SecF [Acidobacteria bacterium]|nr:protein translocase subunit SecF [Acidobacteriota bacterium]MBP7475398.1 protein translocase subunit SecF [Pyrinomonadaceae bacterium]
MFQIFKNINVDWMGIRKPLIFVSIVVLLAGLGSAIGRQFTPGGTDAFNLGVDFQGGTVITAKFKSKPAEDDIRNALQAQGVNDAVIQSSLDKQDEVLIKVPLFEGAAEPAPTPATTAVVGGEGSQPPSSASGDASQVNVGRATVKKALDTFGPEAAPTSALGDDEAAAYKIVGTDSVGPVAGAQLRNQAVIATLLGLVGILLFIAFRYDWTYAAGAVIAVFHDVLITLAFFSVFQWEISLTVLAALLTLVGFSVNDSIVIFDRIRENLTLHRGESLYKLTNQSINQTMSRTIVTNGLVFLSVLALVLFGGEVLRGFSLALFVGSITGTYSTIAIASPIAIWWQSKLGDNRVKEVLVPQIGEKLASSSRRSVTRRPVTR